MVVTESNGGLSLEAECGENWPAETHVVGKHSSSQSAEKNASLVAAEEEGINLTWERLEEVHLGQQLLKKTHNCEVLSPENHLGSTEPDPETANIIFIAPLDGSQAELKSRVIKEVRKPGRSK